MTKSSPAILYNLSDLGIANVRGDDAKQFLQAQLTNDIDRLNAQQSHQLSAYCNPKGRMLALFHIMREADEYKLIAPNAILDKVLPRLKMFVMRARVEIKRLENVRVTGLQLDDETEAYPDSITKNPKALYAQHFKDPSRLLILHSSESQGTFENLKIDNDWNSEDIKQNLPQLFIESYEALIPQSANLDIVEGVSFKKGCFPGQEIIARVKYRGKPKTRMIGVQTDTKEAIKLGAPIYTDGRESAAGMVLNQAVASDNTVMSVSVPVTHLSEGALYLDKDKTINLHRLATPYPITI